MNDPEGDVAQVGSVRLKDQLPFLDQQNYKALNRFKNQLNENSARFARVGVIPEMNHNESVAWGGIGTEHDDSAIEHVLLLLTWQGMLTSFQADGLDHRLQQIAHGKYW